MCMFCLVVDVVVLAAGLALMIVLLLLQEDASNTIHYCLLCNYGDNGFIVTIASFHIKPNYLRIKTCVVWLYLVCNLNHSLTPARKAEKPQKPKNQQKERTSNNQETPAAKTKNMQSHRKYGIQQEPKQTTEAKDATDSSAEKPQKP